MFGLKKKRELKKGTIDKEFSYMMAVPRNEEEISNPKNIIDKLKETTLFQFKGAEMKENLNIKVLYKGEEYIIELIPEDIEIPKIYTINHQFTEENYKTIMEAKIGLTTAMLFGNSSIDSYHLQLKVLYIIVPNMVGIVDFCTERILSSEWTRITAESKIPPSYDYIYCIQAINDEEGNVWLHSHGLNRCGSIEVEVLQSTTDTYNNHYYILQTIAKRSISEGGFVDEEEAFWIGEMSNGESLVGTWISWQEAVNSYKNKDILGGTQDRLQGHKDNTGIVYLYLSEKDSEKKKYTHVSAVDDYISDNLLMMFSNEETMHMSNLAKDRIGYFIKAINNQEEEVHGIMKMGLLVDDEYQNEEKDNKEHIWFEVIEINESKARGILTQEPYYIKSIKAEDEMELDLNDVTDWILYTQDNQITPDSVYLLNK